MATTYTLITSTTLTGSQASVSFSSIPATYTDLCLQVSARGDVAGNIRYDYRTTFNSDTANNYSSTYLYGSASSVATSRLSSQPILAPLIDMDGPSATANTFSNSEVYIPSYLVSQNKPISNFGASEDNSTSPLLGITSGLWRNTAAITSIQISPSSGNFVSGSTFYLYGIKNS